MRLRELPPIPDPTMRFVRRTAIAAAVLVTAIFMTARLLDLYPWNERIFDLWAYWSTNNGFDYGDARPGVSGAYIYSPAFAHLIGPLVALPFPAFAAVWTAVLVAVLGWLSGWRAFFLGVLAPVTMSIAIGQVDLLFAAVIVLGFRYPAVWLLPIITKVTPGVGLVWFAARREWRNLGIALGATFAVVGISYLIDPPAWAGWVSMLLRFEFPTSANGAYLPLPVWVRLPLVALLIAWGARSDRRWVLPVGITLSLPTVWLNTPTILIAILPLVAAGATTPAGQWLRGGPLVPASISLQRVRRQVRRAGLLLRREAAG
jgi:glycosyl transferase family 87